MQSERNGKLSMKTPDEIKTGVEFCTPKVVSGNLKTCDLDCPYRVEGVWCRNALAHDTLEYIERLETKVPKWISVKDQVPSGEDPVLILVKETEHYGLNKEKRKVYYCQYLAYWDGEEWFTTWCNGCRKISDTANEPYADDYEVTHWMPMPSTEGLNDN